MLVRLGFRLLFAICLHSPSRGTIVCSLRKGLSLFWVHNLQLDGLISTTYQYALCSRLLSTSWKLELALGIWPTPISERSGIVDAQIRIAGCLSLLDQFGLMGGLREVLTDPKSIALS